CSCTRRSPSQKLSNPTPKMGFIFTFRIWAQSSVLSVKVGFRLRKKRTYLDRPNTISPTAKHETASNRYTPTRLLFTARKPSATINMHPTTKQTKEVALCAPRESHKII